MLSPHPVSDLASAPMMTIRIPEAIWDEMQAVTDRSHSEARQHRGRSQGRIAAPAERAISQQQYDAIAAVPYQGLGEAHDSSAPAMVGSSQHPSSPPLLEPLLHLARSPLRLSNRCSPINAVAANEDPVSTSADPDPTPTTTANPASPQVTYVVSPEVAMGRSPSRGRRARRNTFGPIVRTGRV